MLGFWIFMLICDLLVPFTMIFFGQKFSKAAPKEISSWYGYRTAMSMKNRDTWEHSHRYFGKIWLWTGLALLPVSVIPMLFFLSSDIDAIGYAGTAICALQMAVMCIPIIFTERSLRKAFDKNGKRK